MCMRFPDDAASRRISCINVLSGDYREKMRLLTHFYSYLYWAKPVEERIYKRLVRDRLHYSDTIFCAAGKSQASVLPRGGVILADICGYAPVHCLLMSGML